MRVRPIGPTGTLVVLSRRNLESLLAKLNSNPSDRNWALLSGEEVPGYAVMAEENEEHYFQVPTDHTDTHQTTVIRRLRKQSRKSAQNP